MAGINLQESRCYALDTVTLIYFLERHPRYYQQARQVFQQIENGYITAVCSSLVFTEILVPLYTSENSAQADKLIHTLTNFPNLKIIPITDNISIKAAQIRAIHGLRTPDAIHLACALQSKTNGFITNDKNLIKTATSNFEVLLFD